MSATKGGAAWVRRLWWVAAGGVVTLGCASLPIRTDYDQEAHFGALRTYAWIDSGKSVRDSAAHPFLERRVRRAVDWGLRERGFVADSEGNPDFLVTTFVIGPTPEEVHWRDWSAAPCGPVVSLWFGYGYPYGYPYGHGYGYPYGYGHGYGYGLRPWRSPYFAYPWGYACSYRVGFGYLWWPVYGQPGDRLAGTLVIDILDARTRELIWRGSAEGAVAKYGGETVSQEELDDIAIKILREFPPDARR